MVRPSGGNSDLFTLEPFLEAVREGVEGKGWELSGLQKTTSHQFEGRWEGEETRSAYLFFHREGLPDSVSLDVFVDETSQGLRGNLALVVSGPSLGELGDVVQALSRLSEVADAGLPEGYEAPVSVRLHLPRSAPDPRSAEVEIRFKLRIPSAAIDAGAGVVAALSSTAARSFLSLLEEPSVRPLL